MRCGLDFLLYMEYTECEYQAYVFPESDIENFLFSYIFTFKNLYK